MTESETVVLTEVQEKYLYIHTNSVGVQYINVVAYGYPGMPMAYFHNIPEVVAAYFEAFEMPGTLTGKEYPCIEFGEELMICWETTRELEHLIDECEVECIFYGPENWQYVQIYTPD